MNLLRNGLLCLLLTGMLSITSCEKEVELLPHVIVNNALQGSWDLASISINGDTDNVELGDVTITFAASDMDSQVGTVLYEEKDRPEENTTDPYSLTEDGKNIDLWDEVTELSVNSTDLKMTNREEIDGEVTYYESNWKKK